MYEISNENQQKFY